MGPHDCAAELCAVQRPDRGAGGPHDSAAELCAIKRPDRGAVGPTDSAAELRAVQRPDRGADSAKADVPADPRLQPYVLRQPYVPRDLHADDRGDRGAELPHAGPHDYTAELRTVEIAHTVALDAADARAEL